MTRAHDRLLYLIRHGQTDWNVEPARCQGWADVPLNEDGREQARTQARTLAGRGIGLIVTSHLLRARQTAEIIRAELEARERSNGAAVCPGPPEPDGVPLLVDERLAETRRGDWEGRRFSDIIRDDPQTWRRYREHPESFRFPGGESLAEHQRRVLAAVRDVAADGRTAALVTHGGSIRLVRAFLEGGGIETVHRMPVANGGIVEVPTAGLTERIEAFLSEPA